MTGVLLRAALAFAASVLVVGMHATTAVAHPLGNFTVNRHAEVIASGDELFLRYSLDIAEVPTIQLQDEVEAKGFGRTLARDLDLRVDGERVDLELLDSRASLEDGDGSLETLRYEAVYAADRSGRAIEFRDSVFSDRVGWREVVVRAEDGARVVKSDVPDESRSRHLTRYAEDSLKQPLDVTQAVAVVDPASSGGTEPQLLLGNDEAGSAAGEEGGFEAALQGGPLGFGAAALALLAAMFWGAAHALTPGHGKAIVAGYLVGTRGRARDAVALGIVVTITHTAGVFALGAITLLLSRYFVPEQLYPWLSLASALLIVSVGAAILVRWRMTGTVALGHSHASGHGHAHGHSHAHAHGHAHGAAEPPASVEEEPLLPARAQAHAHAHAGATVADAPIAEAGADVAAQLARSETGDRNATDDQVQLTPTPPPDDSTSRRGILGMGIAAGLIPCPSALIVLLSAIALDRLAFGFVLIIAFSIGLAATITSIGLVAVFAQSAFRRRSFDGRLIRTMPAISAGLITIVGLVLTVKAVLDLVGGGTSA